MQERSWGGGWTLARLAATLPEAQISGDGDVGLESLAVHSASVRPGALFACLPGERRDGHAFAPAAVAAGAAAVLAERILPGLGVPQLLVPDARLALALMARAWYGAPDRHLQVLAVTGTNGKTTTCFLLEAAFAAAGRPLGLLGTAGHHLGSRSLGPSLTTPEPLELHALLAEIAASGKTGVALEASSHALSQQRLAGVGVDTAIFTNLTRDHLDYHGSPMAYLAAKRRLFAARPYPKPHPALAIVPHDSAAGRLVAETARPRRQVVTFGWSRGADVVGSVRRDARGRQWLRLDGVWGRGELRLPLPGRHNAANALGVLAACLANGLPVEAVRAGWEQLGGVPGRFESVPAPDGLRVVVDFAHNPAGLRAALLTAREQCRGRVRLVFGCKGEDEDEAKRFRMGLVAARLADVVYVTSDDPYGEEPESTATAALRALASLGAHARWLPDRREAIARAILEAARGDLILVAGRGHETMQHTRQGDVPLDDREICRQAVARWVDTGAVVGAALP